MACSCIKKYQYDVHIDYLDCKSLIYEDQSAWMDDEGFDVPETYQVTINIPSLNKTVTLDLYTNKRNIITSEMLLGSSDQCLPDDIYCFSIESCGLGMKVVRAYTCSTDCKIDSLSAKIKTREDESEVTYLRELSDSVKINARLGKNTAAASSFKLLKEKVNHLTCGMC